MFNRPRGDEPKPPQDMGKLLIQALQLLILGMGFLIYLDAQSSTVIWLTIVACIAFGVVAGILLDWMRAKKK
ncbi:hypothetical protein [Aestuariivirga litoralis]|uniref:hypothetical protein n=1 Tax=Aestuariivirga litoralis TaxID=2650924 RepID=UPI0018C4BED5|nr:hypothetical protein [Aestuariivirga litoralis]MBG1231148.1 hypothetical protein [Aestuariivirga litoralis]